MCRLEDERLQGPVYRLLIMSLPDRRMACSRYIRAFVAILVLLAAPAMGGCGTALVAGAATKTVVGTGKLAVKTGAGAVKLTARGAGKVVGLAEEQERDFQGRDPGGDAG